MQFTNFPAKELARGLQAVPTSLTTIPGATDDCYIFQIVVSNTSAGSLNFTLQDNQGTPKILYNAVPVDPSAPLFFSLDELGVMFKTGAKWQASGAGLVAEVVGVVRGS